MASDTNIEWCDDTVNPWWGCTKVSPACANCYAETWAARWGTGWGNGADRKVRVDKAIAELDRIARRSDREGRPRRVFIASMADVFEARADLVEPRKLLWDALHRLAGDDARLTPLLLTKRPDIMAAWADEHGWPTGAWAGTTVENQRADDRIPHLLQVPARVRFLSMEPLLGPVNISRFLDDLPGDCGCIDCENGGQCSAGRPQPAISWVITGGESGPKARPSHPDWFRSLRDQCQDAGVSFFFKQWGAWALAPGGDPPRLSDWCVHPDGRALNLRPTNAPSVARMHRVGKKAAGRLLDGRTWDEVPA